MSSFRVLIVERDTQEASELRQLISAWKYEYTGSMIAARPAETYTVGSVGQALAVYEGFQPSLILFGPSSAQVVTQAQLRQVRQCSGIEPVPLLLVLDQQRAAAEALDLDGWDDVLLKPYDQVLVELKLASIRRFCEFSRSLMSHRNRLRRHHADFLQEQASAQEIFGNLGNESCLDDTPAIRYHLSPRAVLNGDVLAATRTPDGKLVLMLGDFSGHGLSAAVGAVPLTSIFYSMIPRGFSFTRVLREVNRKLHDILPRHMFCCLVMLELDPRRGHLRLFNAGMPSPCLKDSDGELRLLESRHLPLGVLAEDEIDSAVTNLRVNPGDRLFLWSDGIHEARNARGEHFGESRLLDLLKAEDEWRESAFERILVAVNAHASRQHDDLSLVELDLSHPSLARIGGERVDAGGERKGGRIGDWSIRLRLSEEELRAGDPLPHVLAVLVQMPGAAHFQEELAIALGELFRNALEHGVLGLDSALKCTDEGFLQYYALMTERRKDLRAGWVEINLSCKYCDDGGELQLEVEDSGTGFPLVREPAGYYSGRGLALLKTLCRELETRPGSSRVRAVMEWGEWSRRRRSAALAEKSAQT